ncbi:cytoplasmic dynein 1 intermediate chain-like [Scaptodrosophila lebanonensis]|uniref:Cytoplasmic dynein 1 intermediate chain-like n=1 Tax=Drosophila lebanonensis TaxID=7225 RepID=A0A6J2UJ34_DROLE|nr:cytoplasmic dynein 1 intermediate chain-like [Scaptodrosophila lebanonensis]
MSSQREVEKAKSILKIKEVEEPIPTVFSTFEPDQNFEQFLAQFSNFLDKAESVAKPQLSRPKEVHITKNKLLDIEVLPKSSSNLTKGTQTYFTYVELSESVPSAPRSNSITEMTIEQLEEKPESPPNSPSPTYTLEQKEAITLSTKFQTSVLRSGRVMERILGQNRTKLDFEGGSDTKVVSFQRCFKDEPNTRPHSITSLDCSHQYAELILASYQNQSQYINSRQGGNGCVMLWNLKASKKTPEETFRSESAVISACFSLNHTQIVIGGTYAGHVQLWDMRAPLRIPVLRTPLTPLAHFQPICGLNQLDNNQLLTLSTDGKLCTWRQEMLSRPLTTLQLSQANLKIGATCLELDINGDLLVGSERGHVFKAQRTSGLKHIFAGHEAPVTGISCHRQLDHLFLSCSMDWSIKVWSKKHPQPLGSLVDNSDYVMDVAWSPVNPAVFAAIVGCGRLDVWYLNYSTVKPTATITVGIDAAPNRLSWFPNGQKLAVGDASGRLWIYELAEDLVVPSADEKANLLKAIEELQSCEATGTNNLWPNKS